ncbi:hypothetical protein [[Clostridium] dakarense]|uniref:hypothetical protein n=1 Tax=Faecalimicrobium dakarense TaxID=1301100 RepID=UPI0004AFD17A|nr:hypothetical protein [[Clostridium] dakarense]
MRLLSIGTGYNYNSIKEDTTSWGAIDWIMSKNPDLPIIAVTLEGNSQTSQIFSKKLLEDNYHRINPKINKEIAMDDCESIEYLLEVGESCDLEETMKWLKEKWN